MQIEVNVFKSSVSYWGRPTVPGLDGFKDLSDAEDFAKVKSVNHPRDAFTVGFEGAPAVVYIKGQKYVAQP